MTLRLLRPLLLVATFAALALPGAGLAAKTATDRGVVQSVGAGQIVLRSLDGSVVAYPVSGSTRVKLNGVRVTLADIRPGYVANVVHDGSAPATVIRAFGKPATVVDRGVVTAVAKQLVSVRLPTGATVSVALDGGTQFRLHGVAAKRALVRVGATVAVTHVVDGPAKVVNVLKRAGA